MSAKATCRTYINDIPKVEMTWYSPDCSRKTTQLAFVSTRSQTLIHSVRPPKFSGRNDLQSRAMRCREFSFQNITKKAQTVQGFRKGKLVDTRTKQWTNKSLCENYLAKSDTFRQKTQEFSICGQKVNLNGGDSVCSNTVRPREWVIEKSRTLPDINVCLKIPFSTPIKFFQPTKSQLGEQLIVKSESSSLTPRLERMDPGTNEDPEKDATDRKANQEDIRILPGINNSVESPVQVLKAITVSLQTDDCLYYGVNDDGCTPIEGQHVRVAYQPMKTLAPKTSRKLLSLQKPFRSGDVCRKPIQNIFSSFPLLSNVKT